MEYIDETPDVEVAAAAKRAAYGEALPKQPRQDGPKHIETLMNPLKPKLITPSSQNKSKHTKTRKI